jgi:hypothetical protein
MIPSLLIFLCHVLAREILSHDCSVEKCIGVVQKLPITDICYFCYLNKFE